MSANNGHNSNGNGHHAEKPPNVDAALMRGPLCSAQRKRGAGPCKGLAMPNGKCRMHGGASLKGVDAPSYKHGRYSKHLPEHLKNKFDAAYSDPELTHLRAELGLLDTILGEKIERIHAGESGAVLADALKLISDYETASNGGSADGYDGKEPADIIGELKILLLRGRTTLDLFEEVQPIVEQRRKLAESENKRLALVAKSMSVEEAILFVRQLGDSIKRNVSNPQEKAAIFADFERILA